MSLGKIIGFECSHWQPFWKPGLLDSVCLRSNGIWTHILFLKGASVCQEPLLPSSRELPTPSFSPWPLWAWKPCTTQLLQSWTKQKRCTQCYTLWVHWGHGCWEDMTVLFDCSPQSFSIIQLPQEEEALWLLCKAPMSVSHSLRITEMMQNPLRFLVVGAGRVMEAQGRCVCWLVWASCQCLLGIIDFLALTGLDNREGSPG